MAYTPLNSTDSGPTVKNTVNTNFASVDTQLAAKVSYSSTVPAVGDLLVAAATDGLSIKKKVFTASQVLESDSNGQPTSAAKGTAYNKNFGTGATDIPAGDSVVKLTGNQTVAGIKTFSSSPIVPTQSPADNSTKAASTAYVDATIKYANGFGAVTTATQNANTQITADGFLFGSAVGIGSGGTTVTIKTDSSATPTTTYISYVVTNTQFLPSFCIPIKKNEYYIIGQTGGYGATISAFIRSIT